MMASEVWGGVRTYYIALRKVVWSVAVEWNVWALPISIAVGAEMLVIRVGPVCLARRPRRIMN